MKFSIKALESGLKKINSQFSLNLVDRGWNNFVREVAKFTGAAVSVGVQGEEAEKDHGGKTNVLIATVHEFGTKKTPERSFIRSTMDERSKAYEVELADIAKTFLGGNVRKSRGDLLLLGEHVRADIIGKIWKKIPPPLSDETIARKGGEDTPLIDTGQFINSFSAVLVGGSEIKEMR